MSDSNIANNALFHWADYVVFVVILVLSALIGAYYGWRDRKKKTVENFLVADRSMPYIPVGISLFVSYLSSTTFLADPVEVYRYGIVYWYLCIGYCSSLPIIAHFIGPMYNRMKLISSNKYIEKRYNKYLKIFVPAIRTPTSLVYLAAVLMAPALALSQVTPLDVWTSVVVVGLICTFYTTLGGMKAVLWADTVQCVIMLAGLLAVLIRAAIDVGGIERVWSIADEGGRINLDKIDPNPLQHATVWTYLAGGFFRTFTAFGSTQPPIQRYASLPTEKAVTIAVYITIPLFFIFGTLVALTGLVMYAYYHDCDPLLSGRISRPDQMVPLLTMEVLGFLPGVPGLFIACIFSACMSSLSSYLSGMAAFWLKDFIMPLYKLKTGASLRAEKGDLISKILSCVFGLITIGLVFALLEARDSGLFQLTNIIAGSFGSPIAGIFITGIIFPFIGDVAITGGLIVSLGVSFWLGIGSFLYPNTEGRLPINTTGCELHNVSSAANLWMPQSNVKAFGESLSLSREVLSTNNSTDFHVTDLYKLSSLLYFALGPTLTTIVGLIITGFIYVVNVWRGRRTDEFKMESSEKTASKQDGVELSEKSFPSYDNPCMDDKSQFECPVK